MSFTIHHIAITASNIKKSVEFYSQIFKIFGYTSHSHGELVSSIIPPEESGLPDILIYAAHSDKLGNKHQLYDPGIHHFCFSVDSEEDVDEIYKISKEINALILDPPTDYPNYSKNVCSKRYYAVFITDPDNIKLEFSWIPK